jgi:hypothetical protein
MKTVFFLFLLSSGYMPAFASPACDTPEDKAILEKVGAELSQLEAVDD